MPEDSLPELRASQLQFLIEEETLSDNEADADEPEFDKTFEGSELSCNISEESVNTIISEISVNEVLENSKTCTLNLLHKTKSGRVSKSRSQDVTIKVGSKVYHSCQNCDRAFTNKSAVSRHKCSNNGIDVTLLLTCSLCDKTFKSVGGRTKHMKSKHGDSVELSVVTNASVASNNSKKNEATSGCLEKSENNRLIVKIGRSKSKKKQAEIDKSEKVDTAKGSNKIKNTPVLTHEKSEYDTSMPKRGKSKTINTNKAESTVAVSSSKTSNSPVESFIESTSKSRKGKPDAVEMVLSSSCSKNIASDSKGKLVPLNDLLFYSYVDKEESSPRTSKRIARKRRSLSRHKKSASAKKQ